MKIPSITDYLPTNTHSIIDYGKYSKVASLYQTNPELLQLLSCLKCRIKTCLLTLILTAYLIDFLILL